MQHHPVRAPGDTGVPPANAVFSRALLMTNPFPVLLFLITIFLSLSGPVAGGEDDKIIARVNDHPIRLSEVYSQIESRPLGEQIDYRERLEQFARSVIIEEMLFQYLLSRDFEGEPALREEVKYLAVQALLEKQVNQKIRVTDEEIQHFYLENRDHIWSAHARVHIIQLPTRSRCIALLRELADEESFSRAAREVSSHPSAATGGDMGFLMTAPGELGYEPELLKMQPGELRIFDQPTGCHLVRLAEIVKRPEPGPEEIKRTLSAILSRGKERALLEALVEKASAVVTVEEFGLPSE